MAILLHARWQQILKIEQYLAKMTNAVTHRVVRSARNANYLFIELLFKGNIILFIELWTKLYSWMYLCLAHPVYN